MLSSTSGSITTVKHHLHESEDARPAAEVLKKAFDIARTKRACGLRLPYDRRVAIALVVAGIPVRFHHDQGIAAIGVAHTDDEWPSRLHQGDL